LKRIIVSVINDLTTDQRVNKVCKTLENEGFSVLLIGRKLSDSLQINNTYKTKRIKLIFNKSFLFYAEFNFRLFFILLFSKKDVLLSNDLDTLLANFLVSRIQSKKLVYDSHELFTEIPELEERLLVKKCWILLERLILPKLKNTYTVCESIANFYNEKYNTNFKVIKNFPIFKTIHKGFFSFPVEKKKIILYQGSINVGRGLELMIDSMLHLPNHLFIIIGNGDIYQFLQKKIINNGLQKKVILTGKLTPEKLQKLTPLADIGISLEEDFGLNYRFALPNKIFDYIQAEVPILVSNLPEMKHIIKTYNVGEIVYNREPKEIAKQILSFSKKDFSSALKIAKKSLIWEKQVVKLKEIFNNLS